MIIERKDKGKYTLTPAVENRKFYLHTLFIVDCCFTYLENEL